jgi:replicative DNA helicase
MNHRIHSISLQNYADQENLLVIKMVDMDIKVMSRSIMRQMIEYSNAIKNQVEEESSEDDEETLANIANEKLRRLTVGYKFSRLCKGPD